MPIDPACIAWLDFETERFGPGNMLPTPAIATTYHAPTGARLWLTRELPAMLEQLLDAALAGDLWIGGHDVARFDLPVVCQHFPWLRPKVRRALDTDRVVDTIQAERIIEIHRGERGQLALDALARKHGVPMRDKAESHELRISFGQFIGAEHIPPAHAEYALQDVLVPPTVWARQVSTGLVDEHDVAEFCRRAFTGSLCSARGLRTDLDHVRRLQTMVDAKIADLDDIARQHGFLRANRDGTVSKNATAIKFAIACDYAGRAYAPPVPTPNARGLVTAAAADRAWKAALATVLEHPAVPRTDKGNVRTDRLTLEDASHPSLQALAEWDQLRYIRNKDLVTFTRAAVEPVHTRYSIVDTTRYASSDPQLHNIGKLRGVRECIRPRDGFGLVVSDFKMLELVALAQLCVEVLGLHTMAQKIRDGVDMHAEIGADILGCTYEEIQARRAAGDHDADETRDAGKPANFGMNGGMTDPETFQLYARKSYGQLMTIEQCVRVMAAWRQRAVDQQAWIRHVESTRNALRLYSMKHPGFRNLWRHGLRKTEACNNPFQIGGANGAARAGWLIVGAQYFSTGDGPTDGPDSTPSMRGSHLVMTTHDDFVSETPLDRLDAHATVQTELMARAARETYPGVWHADTPTKRIVDTRVLSHLSKAAPATREAGRLVLTQVTMPDRIGKDLT